MFDSVPLPKDTQLPESIRKTLAELPPLNIFRMLANTPTVFHSYIEFAKCMYGGKFDRKLRQIALLRVAHKLPSNYLIVQYASLCKSLGINDREIRAIASENPVVSLNQEANFLCEIADEITLNSHLSDASFRELYNRYSTEIGNEFLLFLSGANMIGRFMNATRLQIENINPLEGHSSFFPPI